MRRLIATLLIALFPAAAMAQVCGNVDLTETFSASETARLEALVGDHAYPEGLIWRATRGDSQVTVVGTLHIPDRRFDGMVARLTPDIAAADVLILEATRAAEAEMAQMAATNPDMFFLTSGPSLIDLLAPEDWDGVAAALGERGIPSVVAAKFKPWYASLVLAVPTCALSAMQSGEAGLDRRLEGVAEAAGVTVTGLEGPEAVLGVFAGASMDEQLDALSLALRTESPGDANTSTLVELYFQGRSRAAWEVSRILIDREGIAGGQALFDEIEAQLLVGRNQDWEGLLPDLVENRDAVLAVGAAHLSGESGVLRAFERAGYLVERY